MCMDKELINLKREVLRLKLEKYIAYNLRADYFPDIKEKVVIYGAGILGKKLYRCFEKKPVAYWDKNKKNNYLCGIPVLLPNEGIEEFDKGNITVVVTPVWDYETIKHEILKNSSELHIVSLENIVEGL